MCVCVYLHRYYVVSHNLSLYAVFIVPMLYYIYLHQGRAAFYTVDIFIATTAIMVAAVSNVYLQNALNAAPAIVCSL